MRRILVAVLSITAVLGCAQTPVLLDAESQFEAYVRSSKFTAFVPPRDGDGAGSIVSFRRGEEGIVASPADCFRPERVVPSTQQVGVLDSEYELTTNDKIIIGLPGAFKTRLDLNADLSRAGVKRVKYRLLKPYTTRITLISARNYFNTLPDGDPCRKLVDDDGNLLLHTVLGAKGIEYSFYGEKDAKMKLTAEILGLLKAEPDLASKYNGTSSLQLNENMLLGYRAWQLTEIKGFATASGKDFVELSPEEVERLRAIKR